MTNLYPEVPQEWFDDLRELRERVAELPEDEEDRILREGASYEDIPDLEA